MNDDDLVIKAQAGDHQAFQKLIEDHRSTLYRYARYYSINAYDAEELVQETIFRAYVALPQLRHPERCVSWMKTIMLRYAMSLTSKQKKLVVNDAIVQHHLDSYTASYDESLYLKEALEYLDEKYRRALVLKYFHDYTLQEISDILGCPIGTVKTHVYQGLSRLKNYFGIAEEHAIERKMYMLKDQLKQKAQAIGIIPTDYELEIEDYRDEEADRRAIFLWKDPNDDDRGIWIELDGKGQLIDLTKEASSKNTGKSLPNEQLQKLALQFVLDHYPNALEPFTLEKVQEKKGERWQFTYSQYELELPLPHTGFSITITKNGEIVSFRYYGIAEKIVRPKKIVHKDEAKKTLLDKLKMETMITILNEELYEDGDDLPHLVFEPSLRFHQLLADGTAPEFERVEEEDSRKFVPLPKLTTPATKDIHAFIGLDRSKFQQIREQDMGDMIGTVWRISDEEPERPDRSLDGFFKQRNENTLKLLTHKNSGQLKSVCSFLERQGSLQLTLAECEEIALQFLYHLYPQADKYFRMNSELENDETNAWFHFELYHGGIHIQFGFISITVNRTTGQIDHYHGPDIHPTLIAVLPLKPTVTEEKAKELFTHFFDVKLQWQKEYTEDSEDYYQLVYKPVYPNLKSELAFIEAESGKVIVKKGLY
ncbi:sigma-70 family RNA polymerase sigma factor [Bacillus sp. REN10]|uniref:sigma-70 family RNA polymerase sigma factor n=1 Tax=Bacillus sp. REN10 TaxID=2782541 RepID=UPI00193C3371|nr:sigma-70 family RNA polymerase sigma factor [Bacillus sp. REN10]